MRTIALCTVALLAVGAVFLAKGGGTPGPKVTHFQSGAGQEETNTGVKKTRRDARYSNPLEASRPISGMSSGTVRRGTVDFVDMDGHDARRPDGRPALPDTQRAEIRRKLAEEHVAKRRAASCSASVIIHGTIAEPRGYITSDDTAIYTVYKLRVIEALGAREGPPLGAGSEVEVTVPGGVARTADGKQVAVVDLVYPRLTPGWEHVLALKYDPEAGDYYVFDPVGVYNISPEGRAMRGDTMHDFVARKSHLAGSPATFQEVMAELRAMNCKGGGR